MKDGKRGSDFDCSWYTINKYLLNKLLLWSTICSDTAVQAGTFSHENTPLSFSNTIFIGIYI